MKHHAATLDGGKAPDRPLARGTSVLILRWDVAKIGFIEEPNRFIARGLRLRDQCFDPRLLAIEDLLALVVAAVSKHRQGITADCVAGLVGHR